MSLPSTAPIILVGMHRSGTSLLARLLSALGVHMGKELDIHHEAWAFKRMNKALLELAGGHWAKPGPFADALRNATFRDRARQLIDELLPREMASYGAPNAGQVWGWKDPRNTFTLTLWRQRFPGARVVAIQRDPLGVTLSMHRRELRRWLRPSTEQRLWPPTLGACWRLGELYAGQVREHCSGDDALLLQYEDLLRRPTTELRRLGDFLGLELSDAQLRPLADGKVGSPTRMSTLERWRLRSLVRLGVLDPSLDPRPRARDSSVGA